MKKTLTYFAFFLLSIQFLFAQTAIEYMNTMGVEFKAIQSATWDYTKTVANNKGARKIDKRRVALIQQIDESTKKVSKMPAFNKTTYFKDSVLSFLKMQKIVIAEDYAKIMDLEDVAESSYDAMEAYMKAKDIASDKLHESSERVNAAEKKFASENNITLVEGEGDRTTKHLKVAGEVFEYYNQIYLIFFKPYKQEAYLLDALNRADIAALEQNKSSLSSVSSESLTKLKGIKAFRGNDNSLVKAANDIITFYKQEADLKFVKIMDFYTKKEAFEKAQKAFEANKKRTNDDINAYNKLVDEFNKSSQEYNAINAELNKLRNDLLNQWNKTAADFTAKYL